MMKTPLLTAALLTLSSPSSMRSQHLQRNGSLAYPVPFTSDFVQPAPPKVKSEYRANWNQHKWNANVSHIASGFLYHSAAEKKVRVDAAADTSLFSSLFDYTNVTEQGVANRMWTVSPSITSTPEIWEGFVNPAFPLISEDLLIANNAVYRGVVSDEQAAGFSGVVVAWDILYQNSIPTTVFVSELGIIQGYDFWSPGERTQVITRYFNILLGEIAEEVFDFPH